MRVRWRGQVAVYCGSPDLVLVAQLPQPAAKFKINAGLGRRLFAIAEPSGNLLQNQSFAVGAER
jgi:hypothetical protein